MLNHGLYPEPLWLPVANGILALLLVTVFVRDYYADVPQAAWIMVAFLAALVAIKGLSMAWSISETETITRSFAPLRTWRSSSWRLARSPRRARLGR